MKKILFYTNGIGLGGVERALLTFLEGLDKEKYDIKVAFQYKNENFFEKEIPRKIDYKYMLPLNIINKSLEYREKKRNFFYKILYSFMLSYERYIIKKNFLEFSKDRELLIDFKSGDFLKLLNLKKDIPKICWIHGDIINLHNYSKRKEKLKKMYMSCEKIISLGKIMKENIIKEMPEIKEKVEIVYNPFNIEKIRQESEKIDNLSDEEIKKINDEYIIMVARLELKEKDFFTLFKAYKIVLEKNKNLKLYILGDGSDREKISNKIRELDLEGKIILLGKKENPYPWIKNSQLLVHSSKSEGFGLVLVEALILKKIVISTDCPVGPKEICDNGKYGVLVEIGDYKAMAREIEDLLKNSSERKKELLNRSKEAIQKFETKKVIQTLEKILDTL